MRRTNPTKGGICVAFDGTLKFDTAIDKTGFKLGLDSLGGIAKTGMGLVTKAVGAASAAVSAPGGYAVKVGEGFESSMAQVIATMGITKDTIQDGVNSYDLLKEAAAAAGESTTFSASEAAGALNYLALAGYDAATAAEALPAVLDLAAAGALDLQYASDLATDAMAALGIEATKENLTAFGDQMAKTASKANTSVAQLGEAILTVGGTAKVLAGGTTELNAALGVLANRGIKGAEGGTHLRNMILSLSAPTDTAKQALDGLGVSALDAEGNMRPLNEVFADLQTAMDGMSDGDTAAVLSDIFNKTDLAAAQAMIAGCGDEFDKLTADLDNCDGAMSDMAKTMNDTLEGDMKSLGSKAEAFGIAIYDSLNEPLRELVQLGGDYVSQLTAAFDSGGFDGLAEAVGGVLGQVVTKLTGYLPELTKLGASLVSSLVKGLSDNAPALARRALDAGLTLIKGIAQAAGDAVELGAALLTAIADGISKRQTKIRVTARNIIRSMTKAISDSLPDMLEAGAEILTVLTEVIAENLPALAESGMQILNVISDAVMNNLPLLISAGLSLLEAISEGIRDNLPALVGTGLELIGFLCSALLDGENLSRLLDTGLQILMAIVDTIVENLPLFVDVAVQIILFLAQELLSAENIGKLLSAAVEILLTLTNAIIDNIDDILIAAEAVVDALCEELLTPENIEKLLTTGAEVLGKLISGIFQIAGKLAGFALMLFEEIGSELEEPDWETIGWEIVEGIISGLIGTKFSLADYLDDFKENWVSGIKDVFGIHSPSKVMKDDVGKFLAMGIGEGFENSMASIGQKAVQSVSAWTSVLPKKAEEAASQFITISDSYLKQLPGMMSEQLTETVQRLIAWGVQLRERGRTAARDLVDVIAETVSALPDRMTAIGRNLVEGLWNGIAAMGDWLHDQITGFADRILAGFTEAFGIHSPSTVMRDYVGKYLAQGIGVGFTDEIPEVGKDAASAFENLKLPEITVRIDRPDGDAPDYPEFPRYPEVSPEAVEAFRLQSMRIGSSIAAPSPTSEIVNNHYSSTNISEYHGNTQGDQGASDAAPSGDIIIPVSIGGQQLETVVIKAAQIANARSGGQTI